MSAKRDQVGMPVIPLEQNEAVEATTYDIVILWSVSRKTAPGCDSVRTP